MSRTRRHRIAFGYFLIRFGAFASRLVFRVIREEAAKHLVSNERLPELIGKTIMRWTCLVPLTLSRKAFSLKPIRRTQVEDGDGRAVQDFRARPNAGQLIPGR